MEKLTFDSSDFARLVRSQKMQACSVSWFYEPFEFSSFVVIACTCVQLPLHPAKGASTGKQAGKLECLY